MQYMTETRPDETLFLTTQLLTYIGNKRKLLPLIGNVLEEIMQDIGPRPVSFADVFAGTGIVSRMARRWVSTLYINDFEEYSAFSNKVYHTNYSDVPSEEVEDWRQRVSYQAVHNPQSGFVTALYAPKNESCMTREDRVFYTRRNAMFIDTARQEIEKAPSEIRPFLLAPLVQRVSVHVNTSGVFKGFYKNSEGIGQFGGTRKNALSRITAPIDLPFPVFSNFEREVYISRKEAADFAKSLPMVDIAYLDPPYNQHPYGSNYFMLNLILANRGPEEYSKISGIPKNWNRSAYNVKAKAALALASLLQTIPARNLLISYNSEGFIKLEEMMDILRPLGEIKIYDQKYNTFRGSRNLAGRSVHVREFLFWVRRG